jgi:hypothetical protein
VKIAPINEWKFTGIEISKCRKVAAHISAPILFGLITFFRRDFETGKRTPHNANLESIKISMENAGIEFILENGGGAGVRLAKPISQD